MNRQTNRLTGRLYQLFRDNQDRGGLYNVQSDGEEATIYLYDAIGAWFGIDAQQFVQDLAAIQAGTIHLRINSPGGDVFDGRAIQTALSQHPANIIAHIDGLAASAATYVALGANQVEMSEGAFFMIHNAWTLAMGNSSDMRATADLLDKVDTSIITDYSRKTGMKDQQIRDMMASETWMSAQEALDNGFVDSIFTPDGQQNGDAKGTSNASKWDLSAYENAPEALKNAVQTPQNYDREGLERRFRLFEHR